MTMDTETTTDEENLDPAIVAATIAFENSIFSSNYGCMTDAIEVYERHRSPALALAQEALPDDPDWPMLAAAFGWREQDQRG